MADVNANIGVNIDTSEALAQLKALQRQISQFHTSIAKSSEAAGLAQRDLQKNFINSVNATGAFSAELRTVKTTSESFTNSLEKNKFSMREYFRYSAASTKTFGRLFKSEFDTIGKVAEDRVKKLQTQYIKLGRDSNGAMKAIAVMPNQLDMGNFSTQTQMAAQKQAIFNQLVKQGSTNLLNFGKNTQWAGRQLMVGFTLPLASLGMVASRTFMEMEAQTIKFRKVYGDLFTPTEETEQALADITALGQMFTKYGVAVSQTVALAADAAAAGFAGVDLQRQTTEATRLSVLGQIDAQKALETTISLQNAFKMSSENLAESIDFLNAVENQTVVSLDDVTTAIPKVAPIIRQLGGNVKDLAFFLTAMKEGGINASEGANALKSGLASLINPSTKAAAMLQSVGINMSQIVESNQGDIKGTVIEFAKALDTLDPLTRARAIEQLFGKFQFARLSTLFSNVTSESNQAARVLDLANSSVEDLASLSEKELGLTADSAMNKFRKSVEDLKLSLVPVGQTFLEAVTPIVEFFGGILEKFNNLSSGVKRALVILTVAIGAIGPIALMTFGLIANAIANGLKLINHLRNGYLRLTGQSQILGEQTEYMTMEQIDAAAAAHSLDQSHARLTQTFTAESSAIAKLIAAYQQGASAGAKFAAINPGMMRLPGGSSPKKFAVGGVVPGTGNSDTVPAMLTPGEFVVTKDVTEEFLPLLMQLNKKRIGFNEGGLVKGYRNATTYLPSTMNTSMGQETGRGISTSDYTRYVGQAGAAGQAPLLAVIARQIGEKVKDPSVTQEFAKVGDLFAQTTVRALNESGVEFVKDIDIEQIVVPALREAAKGITIAGKEIDTALENSINQIRTFGPVGGGGTAAGGQSRATSPMSYKNESKNAQALATALNPEMFRSTTRVDSKGKNKKVFQTLNPSSGQFEKADMSHLGQSIVTTSENLTKEISPYVKDAATRILKITKKQIEQGVVAEAKISSPSKETKKVGADIGRGFIAGAQEYVDDAKAIGQQIGGSATGSNLAQASRSSLYGSGPIDPVQKSIRRNEERKMRLSQIAPAAAMSAKTTDAINAEVAARKTSQQRLSSMNSALMGGTFALTSLAGAGSMASGPLGDISRQVMKFSGLLFGLMSVTQLLTQTKITALAAEKLGLARGAMISAKESASVAGIAGKSGLLGIIGRVAMGLKVFLGPIGIAAGAATALYVGFRAIQKNQEEARLKIQGLGNAALLTSEQIAKLGPLLGFTPSADPFANIGQETKIVSDPQRQKISEIKTTLKEDKTFQQNIKSIKDAKDSQIKAVLTAQSVSLLSQGAPKENVQAYIDALLEEAGKSKIEFKVDSIDITSKKGQAEIVKNAEKQVKQFEKAYNSSIKQSEAKAKKGGVGFIDQKSRDAYNRKEMEKSTEKTLNLVTKSQIANFGAIKKSLETGKIGVEAYNIAMSSLTGNLKSGNSSLLIAKETIKGMALVGKDEKLFKAAEGITKNADAILILQAATAGIPDIVKLINALNVVNSGTASKAAMDKALAEIKQAEANIAKRTAEQAKVSKIPPGTISGDGDKDKAEVKGIQAKINAIVQETKAYKILRNANIDNKTATELSNDAEIASLTILAAKNGTLPKTIALIKKYIRVQKAQNDAAIKFQSPEEALKADTSRGLALIALGEKLIDIKYADKIKTETSALEEQEDKLKSINDQIDNITRTEIDPLKAQIDANNFALEGIALREDAINKNYDTQISALDKIASINQEINNIQKQRMSIADALTRGDISAAAVAAQEARAQQAESAISGERNALTAGRDAAIKALGRNALELKNKQLQYDISVIQNTQILNLEKLKTGIEDKIRLHESEILRLEKLVDQEKSQLTYVGKTKQELENFDDLIGFAEAAGIEFTAELLASATNAKSLAEYLQKVLDIQLKINAAKAGGLGGPGAPENTLTTQPEDVQAKIDNLAALKEKIEKKIGSNDKEIIPPKELTTAQQKTLTLAKQDAAMAGRAADAAKAVAAAKASTANTLAKQDQAMANRAPTLTAAQVSGMRYAAQAAAMAPIKRSMGGLIPKYMAAGGFAKGTDTVPAMLTPGEFVVKKFAVDSFGVDNLRDINNGTFNDNKSKSGQNTSSSVYNYGINVNVSNSNASTDEIARAVITQIKNIDNQRIRGQKY
jgi:TP901 family phage tail tape measure protein